MHHHRRRFHCHRHWQVYRIAAEPPMDHPRAQNDLGWMLMNGEGVEQDPEEAVAWYTKSVENGHAEAANNLGVAFANGDGT